MVRDERFFAHKDLWHRLINLRCRISSRNNIFSIDFRCDFDSVGGRSLIERMKFNILEIQENFENFLDKKEMTFEVS